MNLFQNFVDGNLELGLVWSQSCCAEHCTELLYLLNDIHVFKKILHRPGSMLQAEICFGDCVSVQSINSHGIKAPDPFNLSLDSNSLHMPRT